MHRGSGIFVVLAGALLGACATITTGTDDAINVTTNPPGASCSAERAGKQIGMVSPTPGKITVDKSWTALTITCKRDGYQDVVQRLTATAQPATFGNVILGGGVGLIIDAASGAMVRYEEMPALVMVPVNFSSEQSRDDFFAGLVSDAKARADRDIAMKRSEGACSSPSQKEYCEQLVKERADQRDAELADIAQKRQNARLDGK